MSGSMEMLLEMIFLISSFYTNHGIVRSSRRIELAVMLLLRLALAIMLDGRRPSKKRRKIYENKSGNVSSCESFVSAET